MRRRTLAGISPATALPARGSLGAWASGAIDSVDPDSHHELARGPPIGNPRVRH